MSSWIEILLVTAAVAGAGLYVGRRSLRVIRGATQGSSACGGCSGCKDKDGRPSLTSISLNVDRPSISRR